MTKLTFTLLLVFCTTAQAREFPGGLAYQKKMFSLKKVFREIQKQSGCHFSYAGEMLRGAAPTSILVTNMPLEDVLDQLFSGQPLRYTILDKTIMIKPKRETVSLNTAIVTAPAPPVIKGVVRDANGGPLAGVAERFSSEGPSD